MIVTGRARRFGHDVNTDYIISSTRKRTTIDEGALKAYLMEGVDPAFAASIRPGDIIVAGRNFGCGSAMEVAATVILAAGIHAVVAESFARSFFRNAINNGLLPVTCDTSRIEEGDRLSIELEGVVRVDNLRAGESFTGAPLPPVMLDILDHGGLVGYMRDTPGLSR